MSYSSDESIIDNRLSDASESSNSSYTSVSTLDASNASMDSQSTTQNIRVVARIRPLSSKETRENSKEILKPDIFGNSIQVNKNKSFILDKIFEPSATQSEVYEQTAGDLIQNHLFKGFNVTVLAYGQTGSGKTHTIFGANGNKFASKLNEKDDGIIPRAVHELFNRIKNDPSDRKFEVEMSFIEIYNEEIKDLLSNDSNGADLSIRESADGVIVRNLSRHSVVSPQEVAALMVSASEKRSVASTLMNEVSSRSHAICTLYMKMVPTSSEENCDEKISAKLTLVDLAGSERLKKTGAEGMRLKEGININKGLFVLGQVVSALSELGQSARSSDSHSIHVNYRDSKLTRLLQDSLGGNSKTVMVACVSPADSNVEESINTLRYAERTRNIKNSAVRNVVATSLSPLEAAALRKENQMLKLQLSQAQNQLLTHSSHSISSKELLTTLSTKIGNTTVLPSFLRDGINGLDMHELDVLTKLMIHCAALEEKKRQIEERMKTCVADTLQASLNADKWQLRYENMMKLVKDKNFDDIEKQCEMNELNSSNLVDDLRKEIISLKEKASEAGIDAEVSRAAAAAVLNGKGDIMMAAKMSIMEESNDYECDDFHDDSSRLSAELVAMSGSIENKENLFEQANREHQNLESLRSHFEGALKSLQDEVEILSSERELLISQIKEANPNKPKTDAKVKGLKERIVTLERRMQQLKQKAAEHTKALQLRDQAEQKVRRLEREIQDDKRKRADLQRKMKEESVERRNERKEAQILAAKHLRDNNRIQRELTKVKESAARQETVLRRKAEQAIFKQHRLEEQNKKRARIQSTKSELSLERMEEINSWIESELNSQNEVSMTSLNESLFYQKLDFLDLKYFTKVLFLGIMNGTQKHQSKQKKKKSIDIMPSEPLEDLSFIYDDDVPMEDSDDSDWSPDTPLPEKKKLSSNKGEIKPEIPHESVDEIDHKFYDNMTVAQLRLMLRKNGLTVSGKKSELIKRLIYSARAKKALISPSKCLSAKKSNLLSNRKELRKRPISRHLGTPGSIKVSRRKSTLRKLGTPGSIKVLRKRPISRQLGTPGSIKKMKLSQETISSSLRKGFPISASSRPISASSRKNITSHTTIRRKSPEEASAGRLSPAARVSARMPRPTTAPGTIKSSDALKPKDTDNTSLHKQSNTRQRVVFDEMNTKPEGSVHHRSTLATITNSAKKRKTSRRMSMTKSVTNALLQLEELENKL